MTLEKRVEWISMMHKQNLNGRETEDELFEAGIIAGLDYSKTILQETLKISISLLIQTTEFEVLESFKLKVTELQKVLEETES